MKPIDQTQIIDLPSAQDTTPQQTAAPESTAAETDASESTASKTSAPETDQIRDAIEKLADDETAGLPDLSPISEAEPVSSLQEDPGAFSASPGSRAPAEDSPVHQWFFTFMCINIPFIGWIYLFYLAFSKKRTERRNFARAYLFYKLLFLVISIILLGIIVYISLDILDQLLAYMEML